MWDWGGREGEEEGFCPYFCIGEQTSMQEGPHASLCFPLEDQKVVAKAFLHAGSPDMMGHCDDLQGTLSSVSSC